MVLYPYEEVMNILKAFAQIGALTNNSANQVSPIGELSAISRTFTKDQTQYIDAEFPGLVLHSFHYSENGVDKVVSDGDASAILDVINWVYGKSSIGGFTSDVSSFRTKWNNDQGILYDLDQVGEMISYGVNKYCPAYILFCPVGSTTVQWKLWFADSAFYSQFDEFTILSTKPVSSFDDLFGTYSSVKTLVDAITIANTMDQLDPLREDCPETRIREYTFDWVDQSNHNNKLSLPFIVLIYGEAGDNIDDVKNYLCQWILDNSAHSRDDWALVIPDLFTSTEFLFVPSWDLYAVDDTVRVNGVYAGAVPYTDSLDKALPFIKGTKYTEAFIRSVINVVPTQYKSLTCLVTGGPENRDGINQFLLRHPDWINVPTTNVDFMRMSALTRGLVPILSTLLETAENIDDLMSPPVGYSKITRDGVVYIGKTYEKFLYLVVTKASYGA